MEKDQIPRKIKIWLLGIWDVIVDFCKEQWEDRRPLCIALLGVLLFAVVLLITIPAVKAGQSRKNKDDEEALFQKVQIEPFLSLPEEPYIEDDYVYTRQKVTRWAEESVGEWFSEPDDEMIDELEKANRKLVDDMMEVVP